VVRPVERLQQEIDEATAWRVSWSSQCTATAHRVNDRLLRGFIPSVEANELLQEKPPGTYLIRFSKTHPGSFAVTFVDGKKKIKHCLLHSVQPAGVTLKNPPQVYPSLVHFAKAHTNRLRHPVGTKWSETPSPAEPEPPSPTPDVKTPAPWPPEPAPEESVCLICMDKKRETVFLECGHLACCRECAKRLESKDRKCPVCRRPISRVVQIYRP
jgi:hypothetical protein